MPGTSWPRRCSARISGMPSSAIQVLWPCRMPCGFRPYLTGSQQATGMSSGIGRMPRPRGRVKGHAGLGRRPGGDRDARPRGGVHDGEPGRLTGLRLVAAVAGGAEYTAGVVAAPRVTAVRAEEHVLPAAAMLVCAGAALLGLGLDLPGEQVGQERREVDGQAGFPVGAAVGVVFGREPVERAPDLAELPLDVDLVVVNVVAFEADRLAPAQAGVGDGDDHGEVLVPAGQQRGPLGDQQAPAAAWPRPAAGRGLACGRSAGRGSGAGVAGLYGISGGLAAAASPRMVHSTPGRPGPRAGRRRSGPGWSSPTW